VLIVSSALVLALAIPKNTAQSTSETPPSIETTPPLALVERITLPTPAIVPSLTKTEDAFQGLTTLPPEEQEDVNKAIDRGVDSLKRRLAARHGTTHHYTQETSLVGLTLLECGVSAEDPLVQRLAQLVRQQATQMNQTYQLSLTILFLDRLGKPEDEPVLRKLAARLLAGQSLAGGWTYGCPHLSDPDEKQFLTFLESHAPPSLTQLSASGVGMALIGPDKLGAGNLSRPPRNGEARPGRPDEAMRTVAPMARTALPSSLQSLPIVRHEAGKKANLHAGSGDNSNTQFAILGVWAARRHGVAVEPSLALVASRFHVSQNSDGGWGYSPHGGSAEAMTCAGLLGLAAGRAGTAEGVREAAANDPVIEKGLTYLGNKVGKPESVTRKRGQRGRLVAAGSSPGLYWLWSLERVGVIYNLKTIGGKDWYTWSTRLIVNHQQEDGSWRENYEPTIDTCFALLVLKRVNVATDLTQQLNLIGPVRDPGAAADRNVRRPN
jgi:hypothetical protein